MDSSTPYTVAALSLTAIKGLRIRRLEEVWIGPAGVREDRRFYLVDERGRMVNAKRLGALQSVQAEYDDDARRLSLTFPDGSTVVGAVELGEAVDTTFFSASLPARPVLGPFAAALTAWAGETLRLVEANPARPAVDRGALGTVSLVSSASLARLAEQAGADGIDGRRFRMLLEVAGPEAHEEDSWIGRSLRVGQALVRLHGHVGRCLVTGLDPQTGHPDLPTLDLLRAYRDGLQSTEPLPFGVHGAVLEPGRVRVGDPVTPQ